MSVQDEAVKVVGEWIDDNLPHNEANFGADEGITEVLADAGLLADDSMTTEYGVHYHTNDWGTSWGLELDTCKRIVQNLKRAGHGGNIIARHVSSARNITLTEEPK